MSPPLKCRITIDMVCMPVSEMFDRRFTAPLLLLKHPFLIRTILLEGMMPCGFAFGPGSMMPFTLTERTSRYLDRRYQEFAPRSHLLL